MIWPTTMAFWVNSQRRSPNSPLRASSMYTVRPTTTAGRAISVWNVEMSSRRPVKRRRASAKASNRATGAAIRIAHTETRKDIPIMVHNSASPEISR